ncbi:DUF2934 domain-containing protein [Bdellovibrio sp. HCB185ZH]|uniref:DUF2934 domain-containing protein n=1 Tax=Bdellovibrio sp. HCB185ZH TaxID=3394235 RepID=UPI0039A54C7F
MPRVGSTEKLNKSNKSVLNEQSLDENKENKSENKNSNRSNSANASSANTKQSVSPEERERMIKETAFYLAEREGFSADNQIYWLRAEEQIDKMLNG